MMKWTLLVLLIAFTCFGTVLNARAEGSAPVVGVLLKSTTYQFWKNMEKSFHTASEEHDINIIMASNTRPNDGQAQLNLCETMLLKSPDALIVGAINLTNLQSCLRKANARNIPVVDIDGNITKQSADRYGIDVAFSVAADNKLLGKRAAQYLDGKQGKVLILEGMPGSLPSIERKKGFLSHLPDGLEVVASQPTDWDRIKAANITGDTLLKHPDLDIIFSVADAMALGAYEAAKQAGKAEGLIIIGVDGNPEAKQAIREGKMTASIAQLPSLMAKEALLKTRDLLKGKAYSFEQYLPTIVLTKDVLEQGDSPLLQYTMQ